MICPNCEYEYMEGITLCADCGSPLIPVEEFEGHLVHPSDWSIIYTCSEDYEAQMLKANLEGAGIETLIIAQKDRNYPAVGNFAVIKLLVQKKDINDAIEILNDINRIGNTDEAGDENDKTE